MDKVIVAASTHWDREWYRTFQEFQIRLCDLINKLLDVLEGDEELVYTFDGQSVVLEDYLEIHPENRYRLENLCRQGRLFFGPLYNLPDEFLSGGEALIRNFIVGKELCGEFGGRMNAGYVPDNFGHISQLPQILQGVGISSAFFFRGCSIDTLKSKEFWWEGADGSKVLGEYMPLGYWSLKSWGRLGMEAMEHFQQAYSTLKKNSTLNTFLLIHGSDHLYHDPDFTSMVKAAKEAFPQLFVENGSLQDYALLAAEAAEKIGCRLPTIKGELRDFRYGPDPTAVTSCRHNLKRLLFSALGEIEKYTEPISAIAYCLDSGFDYPKGIIKKAWKNILKALGHDGVTGCSTDLVIRDIEGYLRHAKEAGDCLSGLAMERLAQFSDQPSLNQGEQLLVLFNPHSFEYDGITEQVIYIEEGEVSYKDFQIFDSAGMEVEYELLEIWQDVITREFPYNSKERVFRKCFRVLFNALAVPSLGMKTYIIKKNTLLEKRKNELYTRLQGSKPYIENAYYKITVNQDGSINVYDKANSTLYENLNGYVSRGEAGDEYQHVSPLRDSHVFPQLKGFRVECNSPLSQRLVIFSELQVPEAMDWTIPSRSESCKPTKIATTVSLYSQERRIDFKVKIENNSSDHILFAKFPTKLKNPKDYSYISFDEVYRDNHLFVFDPELKSTQSLLKPMQEYGGIVGDDGSLHILTKGIYEYHTKEGDGGLDFYITLLRSTSYMFHGLPVSWLDGQHSTTPIVKTDDSRELGVSTLEYALYLNQPSVAKEAKRYAYPLRSTYLTSNTNVEKIESFLNLNSHELILSAIKKAEDSAHIIVRLFNISNNKVSASLSTTLDIAECMYCNLLEEQEEQADFSKNEVKLKVGAKKIITLKILFSPKNLGKMLNS